MVKSIIFLTLVIYSAGFGRILINNTVGDEIDSCEANFYRLFRDIDGFVSVHFYEYENSDSVLVEMYCIKDSAPVITHRNIDRRVLKSLDYYTQNFKTIIENKSIRDEYASSHKIDWPIVTVNEIQEISAITANQRLINSICCITGVTATAAYLGALLGKSTHQHTMDVSCLAPGHQGSCSVPIEYDVYTVDKKIFLASAAAGFGAGYLLSKTLYKKNILSEALKHDIVVFDDRGTPISNREITEENQGFYKLVYGTLGCVTGIAVSAVTVFGLLKPWSEEPDNDIEFTVVMVPIVTISAIEGLTLFKISLNEGQQLDRLAAIERIKKKRNTENHQKK